MNGIRLALDNLIEVIEEEGGNELARQLLEVLKRYKKLLDK